MYFPNHQNIPLSVADVRAWYANLEEEIRQGIYTKDETSLLCDRHNYYGKLFDPRNKEFFLNHFAKNLTLSINYLMNNMSGQRPRILEMGSGCGNQLLLLAFLGAEVVGCDIREDVCRLVARRKEFYENASGRKLNISLERSDVFTVKWSNWGQFDGLNFLFSFNNLQPNKKLLNSVGSLLKPGGKVVFQETNLSNYYNRIFRKRDCMLPKDVAEMLIKNRFRISSLKGGFVLPPFFWRFAPGRILSDVDDVLCHSVFLSPSYHLMAEKT